jgi:hypothetical protein
MSDDTSGRVHGDAANFTTAPFDFSGMETCTDK